MADIRPMQVHQEKEQDFYLRGSSTLPKETNDNHINHCKIGSVAKEKLLDSHWEAFSGEEQANKWCLYVQAPNLINE